MKKCLGCQVTLTAENAYYHKEIENFAARCKSCKKQRYAAYYQKNKQKISKRQHSYYKERESIDINFKLQQLIRARLRRALQSSWKVGSAVQSLDCSIVELKQYLESKFQPGMSWNNRGNNGWHIDHIKPLSSFDLTNPEQFKQACHYTNLQPLWASDNLMKGAKHG